MKEKTEKKIRFWCRIFLGVYLILVVYFLIFSEEWGRTFLEGEYRYNLIPLQEIGRYLRYREQIGIGYVCLNLGETSLVLFPLAHYCRRSAGSHPDFSERRLLDLN